MATVIQHMVLSDEPAITFIRPKGKRNLWVHTCDSWWGQGGHTGTPAYLLLAVTQRQAMPSCKGVWGL